MSFSCTICKTEYKSYKSLWNHNNKFHANLKIKITSKTKFGDFTCSFCNNKFTRKSNLQQHIKKVCKIKNNIVIKNIELENKVLELAKEVKELKETKNNSIVNNNTNSNNMINNGTVNNIIYINKTGTENILDLNKKEIAEIFDKDFSGLLTFVEKINFNERLPSNHSFCTTNLDSAYLSVYDTEKSKVTKDRKKYFFEEVISKSVTKMEELYKVNKNNFKPAKRKCIEETLNRLNELRKMDMSKKILKEMIKRLNIISYNDHDIVQDTWNKRKHKGIVPKTFEEDLEMDSDNSNEDDDSDSECELPKLIIKTKPKNNEIVV